MKQKLLFIALKKKSEITNLFQKGRLYHANNISCKYYKDDRVGLPVRILLGVSKKVGNATVRNRLKRVLRSHLQLILTKNYESFANQQAFQIALMPKKEFLEMKYKERKLVLTKMISEIWNIQLHMKENEDT